ncbi:hypothetical protein PV646_21240 [Streptomyces sp. ID05-26A]|nr:hypothetical protein [Streptomyces sp. ID05-26A]
MLTAPTREVSELLHQAADVHLRLRGLDAPAVAELAASRGVLLHPSMAERLWRHTGGLPRHVLDLLDEVPRDTWSRFAPELPAPSAVESRTGAR